MVSRKSVLQTGLFQVSVAQALERSQDSFLIADTLALGESLLVIRLRVRILSQQEVDLPDTLVKLSQKRDVPKRARDAQCASKAVKRFLEAACILVKVSQVEHDVAHPLLVVQLFENLERFQRLFLGIRVFGLGGVEVRDILKADSNTSFVAYLPPDFE